jgi:hypothetical protein
MGLVVRFCECGSVLSTEDVREGRPLCKTCRKKKGIKIPILNKIVRIPNPAPDLWSQRHQITEV